MLQRLLPDQISKLWKIISYSIEESLPKIVEDSSDRLNNILADLLSDKMQCWISYNKDGESNIISGIGTTYITLDPFTRTKSLMLYTAYTFRHSAPQEWTEGYHTLRKWALSKGCERMVCYTDSERIVKNAAKWGADMSYTFISFRIKEEAGENIQKVSS